MDRVAEMRRFFARLVTANVGLPAGSELEAAFAQTPREQFVGPPPWKIFTAAGYIEAGSKDAGLLYQDVVVSLGTAAPLNNGQPTLHAYCLNALNLRKGEQVLHIGAGTGYYTTILARLVGEGGRVTAYEMEPELARRAAANVAPLRQVTVLERSGAIGPLPKSDAIYVNAGATEPLGVWLDALKPHGRLLFPLTPSAGSGAMLLVTRPDERDERAAGSGGPWPARFLMPVQFVGCVGARDEEMGKTLSAAFRSRAWGEVRALYRKETPGDRCWCAGRGWWLSAE